MDYIGSKIKLNEWIFDIIQSKTSLDDKWFFDSCAGSGAVSKHAASLGANIIATDVMSYSQHLVTGSISFKDNQTASQLLVEINALQGTDGFFFNTYSEAANRLYFSMENARKIDAIRDYITNVCDPILRSYLLYCSIEAISRVSNTTGVQGAFLKQLKPRALQPIIVRAEQTLESSVSVYAQCNDALLLMENCNFREQHRENILYIDPPYNTRQYAPNYHLFETFVLNDNPIVKGVTGLREWSNTKSQFCSKRTCGQFLNQIVAATTAEHIFISYSSDGLLSKEELMRLFPRAELFKKEQKRFKADSQNTRTYDISELQEYLFYLNRYDLDETPRVIHTSEPHKKV